MITGILPISLCVLEHLYAKVHVLDLSVLAGEAMCR